MRLKIKSAILATVGAMSMATSAHATSYLFNINYAGSGIATLASGSDDPLTTTMVNGDSFTINFNAIGGNTWKSIGTGGIFPFFALPVSEAAVRTADITLNLNRLGSSVFSFSDPVEQFAYIHLGTNTLSVAPGLEWDQYVLQGTLISGQADFNDATPVNSTTINSLIPIYGAPEIQSPSLISFSAAGATGGVPEPATWAMMLLGFGAIGFAMRKRSNVRTTVSYA